MSTTSGLPIQALKAHVSLNVQDLTASVAFYRQLWGIDPVKVRPGYAKFDVANPPLNLALNEVKQLTPGQALSHLGIQVNSTADVLAVRHRWQAAGLTSRDELQTNCCYALQDKTWVSDPDGNQWEVFVVLADQPLNSSQCCGVETSQIDNTATTKCATPNTVSESPLVKLGGR
jgi:catechol 2,3-dioxygenase-like lactoylglutathione lyase family enzyme